MNTSEVFYSSDSHHENIVFSVFYILVFVVAVPGNALALWAFFHQENTSPSRIFLMHLSVADLSYILILPMRIVYHLSDNHWPFGHVLCELSGFLFYLNMYSSLYLMSLISLDRCLAVVLPLKSRLVRNAKYARIAVGVLWVLVIVSMSPTLFSIGKGANSPGTCNKLYLEKTTRKALVSTIVAFVIPLTTVVVSYILILLKLRTVTQQEERPVKDKAIKMIILIVTNFLLAFVPYHVSRVIYIVTPAAGRRSLGIANRITSALTCVSGVLDPVMYFFLNRAYRDQLLWLFCKKRRGDQ
ncbi:uracil nucleotide/cysteinyl leukotriene receptor [Hippoglossus hippoglossus]|uniref:uracil nucleotide/cysteinyl leukotriene receptor n=1 Tax=Hippoglossus hippoglossus TaxID=8267 RepID=UPI00148E54A4|nr:uracil nucleotide/cysteinyl leukotriene receptor [Hippoglossus hippoglossus]XP_034427805.1 uracil nucleotide/cysteinyl leukotriene receptor [Hippoglossus hippoglossus]